MYMRIVWGKIVPGKWNEFETASLADCQLALHLVDLPVTVRGSISAIAMNSLVQSAVGEPRIRAPIGSRLPKKRQAQMEFNCR